MKWEVKSVANLCVCVCVCVCVFVEGGGGLLNVIGGENF